MDMDTGCLGSTLMPDSIYQPHLIRIPCCQRIKPFQYRRRKQQGITDQKQDFFILLLGSHKIGGGEKQTLNHQTSVSCKRVQNGGERGEKICGSKKLQRSGVSTCLYCLQEGIEPGCLQKPPFGGLPQNWARQRHFISSIIRQ